MTDDVKHSDNARLVASSCEWIGKTVSVIKVCVPSSFLSELLKWLALANGDSRWGIVFGHLRLLRCYDVWYIAFGRHSRTWPYLSRQSTRRSCRCARNIHGLSRHCRTVAAVLQKLPIKSGCWVTTSFFFSFGRDQSARSDSTQSQSFRTCSELCDWQKFPVFQFFSVLLSRKSDNSASGAMITLTIRLNSTASWLLSWVESNRALWYGLRAKT